VYVKVSCLSLTCMFCNTCELQPLVHVFICSRAREQTHTFYRNILTHTCLAAELWSVYLCIKDFTLLVQRVLQKLNTALSRLDQLYIMFYKCQFTLNQHSRQDVGCENIVLWLHVIIKTVRMLKLNPVAYSWVLLTHQLYWFLIEII
jgi:hypothetical protein